MLRDVALRQSRAAVAGVVFLNDPDLRKQVLDGGRIVTVLLASAIEVLKPWPLKVVIDNVLRGVPMVSFAPPSPSTRTEDVSRPSGKSLATSVESPDGRSIAITRVTVAPSG